MLILFILSMHPVFAVERVVTTTADSGPGSLRQMLADAQPGDTITFDLTSPATITVNSPLVLNKDLAIEGLGPDVLSIKANGGPGTGFGEFGMHRTHVVTVAVGANVVISGVKIVGDAWIAEVGGIYNAGTLTLQNSAISEGHGRGIHNTGVLTVLDSTIEHCKVNVAHDSDPHGAGIYNDEGSLRLERSALIGNQATDDGEETEAAMGGGLFNTGVATLTQVLVRSNEANKGGGIANGSLHWWGAHGKLKIIDSEILGNHADLAYNEEIDDEDQGHGGGLYNSNIIGPGQGRTTILRSTFADNVAAQDGGGIYASGEITLTNSTLVQNRADKNGGAIFYTGDTNETLMLHAVTMVQNAADHNGNGEGAGGGIYFDNTDGNHKPQIGASVIVENTIGDAWSWPQVKSDCAGGGELHSLDYNILGDVSACVLAGALGNTVTDSYYNEVSALLSDHGGPTRTFPPSRNSANIANQIPITACMTTTDQRGIARPQDGACEIGAYEFATLRWDGETGDGLWTTDTNWKLNVQPGGGDRVVLDGATPATITIGPSDFPNEFQFTVAGLEISNPNVTLAHQETLNVYRGDYDQSAGTFNGSAEGWLQVYDFNLNGGLFNAPYRTLINEDFNMTGGTFNPNGGRVEIREGVINHATQNIVGPVTFYDLLITRYYTDAVVAADGELTVTNRLTVEKGTFRSSSGYHHVQIDTEGILSLSDDITVSGDWHHYGDVQRNGYAISFTGVDPQTLQATQVVSGTGDVPFLEYGHGDGMLVDAEEGNLGEVTVTVKLNEACTTVEDDVFARCFDIETEHAPTNGATLTFFFYADEIPAGQSCAVANVYHWNGSAWDAMTLDTGYGTDGRICGAEPYSIRVENVTDASPFVLSEGTPTGEPAGVGDEHTVYLPLVIRQ
ncbi:MAG: choice-of-anchor Q domain-containing protein [Anaerolineae bacterium]